MAFEEQNLHRFLEARDAAAELLKQEGLKSRAISLEEALVMQAASHLLSMQDVFHGLEIVQMVHAAPGAVYPTLGRFEEQYRMTLSTFEDPVVAFSQNRPQRREYQSTGFGKVIFGLFTPEK